MTGRDDELERDEDENDAPAKAEKPGRRRKKSRAGKDVTEVPRADYSKELSPLSRYGYLSGLAGATAVMAMGYLAAKRNAMDKGWNLYPSATPPSPHLTAAFVLLVIGVVMYVIELGIRVKVDGGKMISVAPDVKAGRYGAFLQEAVVVFLAELALLSTVFQLFKILNEYGFERAAPYYQPWFAIMPYFWWAFAVGGLPYVVLTRAFQYDPDSDKKQTGFLVIKAAKAVAYRVRFILRPPPAFDKYDRSALLGIFVKGFYVPLMTVFFSDQFSHLVRNWAYIVNTVVPQRAANVTVLDVWNVSHSVIFAIDVGVAWAGYAISSRWIKNTLFSVEPTLTGWSVALICYPPFQSNFGNYFSTPSENAFLQLQTNTAVNVLTACSIASFAVYTSATICFGLRFSNLTHRGIIRTGPYALIRHPAYAAKNFSWWCIMFPFALHEILNGKTAAITQVLGLVAMTGIYALRALTEERHLGKDPEYKKYCEEVPYRFIPGVL